MAYEVELEDGTILEFSTMPTQANIMAAKGLMKGHPPTKDFNLKDALVGGWAQAGNAVDLAASTLLGHSAMQAGNQQFVDSLEEGRKNREEIRNSWTDQTKPPGFAEKAVGLAASFPGQVVTSGLASTTSTKTMLDAGESANRALAAGGVSAVGNTAMLAVPALRGADWIGTALANFGLGAAQDAGTKAVIQQIAQTKKGKEAFEPHAEDAFLSGLVGAGIGVAAIHGTPRTVTPSNKKNGNPESALKALETPVPDQETSGPPPVIYVDKNGVSIPPEQMGAVDAAKARLAEQQHAVQNERNLSAQQADVFEPYTNMHRDYTDIRVDDGKGGERPLTRAEFETTLQKLAEEKGTGLRLPEDMEAAYNKYLEHVNEKQAGLFDIGSRKEAFDTAVAKDPTRSPMDAAVAKLAEGSPEAKHATEVGPEIGGERQLNNLVLEQRANEHPFVKAAEERVAKQEQLIVKLSEQVQNGKASPARLAKEMKNLQHLEDGVSKVRENVMKGNAVVSPGRMGKRALGHKQGGAVDPSMILDLFPDFKNSKMVDAYGKLKLFFTGTSKDKDFGNIKPNKRGAWFTTDPEGASMYAKDNDSRDLKYDPATRRFNEINTASRVHQVYLNLKNPKMFTPEEVKAYQSKSDSYTKAETMAFDQLRAQGYDGAVYPGGTVVVAFNPESIVSAIAPQYKGATGSKKIHPYEKEGTLDMQGGFGAIKPSEGKKVEALKAAGKTWSDILGVMHHTERTPEDVIALAKESKDIEPGAISKAISLFTKGKIMAADKAQHPVVTFAAHTALEAERKANALVQHVVHDSMAPAARKLSNEALVNIKLVMDYADMHQKTITKQFLEQHGFNPDQIHYWEVTSGGHKQGFASINKARVAMGLEPLTERQGYSVMMANGEFKRLVMDKATDEVVGVVSADSRSKLNERAKAMRQKGYTVGKEMSYVGDRRTVGGNEFMQVLESLAGNDPRVAQFLDVMHDVYKGESMRYMGMDKRMMDKKGVFGTTGRKPWLNELENAKEFANAQVAYVEHALRFGELAEANAQLKKVLLDKDVAEKHSNAVQAAKEMMDSAMGINPSDIGKSIDAVARQLAVSTGWGGMRANTAFQAAKKFISYKFFALNPQYYVASLLQPMAAIPAIKQVLASRGLDLMFDGGTGSTYLARGGLTMLKAASAKEALSPIERGAVEYNRTHHVYGSDLMQQSSATRNSAGHIADVALTYVPTKIESATRGQVFYSLVHMLSENGMTAKEGLYKTAHNYTDAAMVNYARSERARIHDMAGPMGELTSHIAAYKAHQISMLNYFAREIGRQMKQGDAGGTVQAMRPLAAAMISQVVFAGLRGLPLYAEINEIVKYLSKELGSPTSLNEYMFELADKIGGKFSTGISNGVFSLLNHVHKDIPGVDTSNAMGMGNTIPDSVGEAFWTGAVDTGKTIASIWNAGKNRDEVSTKAMLRELAPPLVRNWMDQAWFTDHNTDKGQLAHNPDNVNKTYQRTENDRKAKMFGFTGIEEAKNKTQLYDNQTKKMAYEEIRTKAIQQASREFYAHKTISDEAIAKYMKAEGDPKALDSDIQRMVKAQNMDTATAELLKTVMSKRISSLNNARRMAETRNANQR